MKTKILIIVIILVCLSVGGFFVWKDISVPEEELPIEAKKLQIPETESSHFGFMHPQHSYSQTQNLNVYWERPHPGPFIWDELQKDAGEYDWSFSDNYIKKSQSYNFNIIGTIWPFADWDQKSLLHQPKQ